MFQKMCFLDYDKCLENSKFRTSFRVNSNEGSLATWVKKTHIRMSGMLREHSVIMFLTCNRNFEMIRNVWINYTHTHTHIYIYIIIIRKEIITYTQRNYFKKTLWILLDYRSYFSHVVLNINYELVNIIHTHTMKKEKRQVRSRKSRTCIKYFHT